LVLVTGAVTVLAACDSDSERDARGKSEPSRTSTAPTTTTRPPISYQVEPGDTLTSIAAFFGVSTAAIAEANQLANQDQLTEGQVLVIPPPPPPKLTITPDVGLAGETFTLTATGAAAGEAVTFTINAPRGRPFTGPPHTASDDGAVTTEYDSEGDGPGTYIVDATGDRGYAVRARYRLQLTEPGGRSPNSPA
jgi:LysM repeat protein